MRFAAIAIFVICIIPFQTDFAVAAGTITVTSPNGVEAWEQAWEQGTTHNITWDYDAIAETETVYIYIKSDGGTSRDIIRETPCDGSYSWSIDPTFPPDNYKIVIRGNGAIFWVSDESDEWFEITGEAPPANPPHIISTSPESGPSNTLIIVNGINFNPDPRSNTVGFCEGSLCVTWAFENIQSVNTAGTQLTVRAPYGSDDTELTFIIRSLTAAGWAYSDNTATFTRTEECPTDSTICECVYEISMGGSCGPPGHCSSVCASGPAGEECITDAECRPCDYTCASQPCSALGATWTEVSGFCIGSQVCCKDTDGGDGEDDPWEGGESGVVPVPSYLPGVAVELNNPLSVTDLPSFLNAIINFIFWIGMAIAPVIIIIAGFIYVTSAGTPGRVTTAKRMILYAAIGVIILLTAKGLILLIKSILGASII